MNQKHKKNEQARISSSILFIFKRPTPYDLGAKQSLFSCHEVVFCISLKHTKVDRESNWLAVYSAEKNFARNNFIPSLSYTHQEMVCPGFAVSLVELTRIHILRT